MGWVPELFWNVRWWVVEGDGKMAGAACYRPSELHICVESCPPKVHIHPEPQNMTLFRNRVFAVVISSDEVILD